jgi:hypothetical protein
MKARMLARCASRNTMKRLRNLAKKGACSGPTSSRDATPTPTCRQRQGRRGGAQCADAVIGLQRTVAPPGSWAT